MRRDPRSGTTLLETMIALGIMALIAMTLAGGMRGFVRSLTMSSQVSDAVALGMARAELRGWLEASLSLPFPGNQYPGFNGTSEQLEFRFVDEAGNFWAGDPVVVRVSGNQAGLIVATATGSIDESGEQKAKALALTAEPASIQFEYFGRFSADAPIGWAPEWSASAGLPLLVRMTISSDIERIPPITIRPGKALAQSEMSLSSLVPPSLPSLP
jgi:hypothetical protein